MAAEEVVAVSQREAAGRYRRWNQFAQLLKTLVHYWAQGPKEDLDFCGVMLICGSQLVESQEPHFFPLPYHKVMAQIYSTKTKKPTFSHV